MNALISVIIPVYNASIYLAELLDSVITQNYTNLEILCIDDGSADLSLDILSQYARNDERIRFFAKKNTGVSDTRNFGIENATGEYIYFCDADDILDHTLIDTLYMSIADCDLACVDFVKYEGQFVYSLDNEIVERNEFCKLVMRDNGYLWNKLFKASIIKNFCIRFCPEISMSEDQVFIIEYLKYVEFIRINKSKLYFYRLNENSAMRCRTITDRSLSICIAVDRIVNLIEEGNYSKECLDIAIERKIRMFSYKVKELLFGRVNHKLRYKWLDYIVHSYRETKCKHEILCNKKYGIKMKLYYRLLCMIEKIIK